MDKETIFKLTGKKISFSFDFMTANTHATTFSCYVVVNKVKKIITLFRNFLKLKY